MGEDGGDHRLCLGAQVAWEGGWGAGEYESGKGSENLAEGDGRGVAVDY